eukprot:TRINITY_DN3397_c0_g3_i1.p1 TRINITY_DN3397_c0_g3~~TRINITY_DN3397_c0_g3_i1.p1  ORF type:complete len:134 (+),score=49.01 TRINITY_DN3397_c0_g3_i1:65-466(+)
MCIRDSRGNANNRGNANGNTRGGNGNFSGGNSRGGNFGGGRNDNAAGAPGVDDKRLFVGGIGDDTAEDQLRGFFEKEGLKPREVFIPKDKETNAPRGFAFVSFTNAADATEALRLDGDKLNKRKLRINLASRK